MRRRSNKKWKNLENINKKIEKWERKARHGVIDPDLEKKLHSLHWRKLKIIRRLHVL